MRHTRFLAIFLLISVALRWGTFFISVINHDESTYVVIADEMLRGEVYLQDVIDTKPIGIFLIYMGIIKATGGSIFMLRLAAAVVVALGAWGLYFAGRRATGSDRVGFAAGTIYLIACSIFTYYGISPNTEIFFNGLTIAAIALAVAPRIRDESDDPFWHWPVAGLLLGLAMVIKPFAAAEALAVGLFMVWFYRRRFGRLLGAGLALVGAFAVPLAGLVLYYRGAGLWDNFLFYTFEVAGAYPVDLPWYLRLKYMGDYLLRYSPFVILGAAVAYHVFRLPTPNSRLETGAGPQVRGEGYGERGEDPGRRRSLRGATAAGGALAAGGGPRTSVVAARHTSSGVTRVGPSGSGVKSGEVRRWLVFLLLQFLTVTTVVLLTGKRFGHYQVQLHPVVAAFGALFWLPGLTVFARLRTAWWRKVGPGLLAAVVVALGISFFFKYRNKTDRPHLVAEWLNAHLEPGETHFGINGWQMAYHLTGRPVPTPYVHSSLLYLDHHVRAFQVDELAEAERIIADPSVRFLVGRTEDPEADTPLTRRLLEVFTFREEIGEGIVVYQRR